MKLNLTRSSPSMKWTLDTDAVKKGVWYGAAFKHIERNETDLVVADPFSGEVKRKVRVPYLR